MKNFERIKQHQLTPFEWDALRAALPCQGGVPLVPGLLEELTEMRLTYFELFVLKPVCMHDVSDTHYVLLGWQDDDDLIPNPYPPIPWIFGIYAEENYRYHDYFPGYDSLPSFDELYQAGLKKLHLKNRRDVRKGVIEGAVLSLLASAFVVAYVVKFAHLSGGTIPLAVVALAGIVGAVLGGISNHRKLPKPDEAPTTV